MAKQFREYVEQNRAMLIDDKAQTRKAAVGE